MTTLERLMQGDEPTWKLFLDTLNEPLLRRLTKFANGDKALAEDYVSEIWVMIVQAIGKINKQQAANEENAITLLSQGDEATWKQFADRIMHSFRSGIGRVVDDKREVEEVASHLLVSIVANIRYLSTDSALPPQSGTP